jgi:hypothetical protein
MAADISDLDYFVLFAQDFPDGNIRRSAFLEMAMMAVLPELAIIGPVCLNRAGKSHLRQQQLKYLINAPG